MERARELREGLVSYLQQTNMLHDPRVISAFRTVPRHRFVPEDLLPLAYEDRALVLKERDGVALSSISQPGMIAQMLEMLDVRPGAHVLDIGTGSGYNAALMAELAGPEGRITSVELEADLAEQARRLFTECGYSTISVQTGDGERVAFAQAFDRIIVTARAKDISAAWWSALKDGGRIVAPLDLSYGGERVVAFVREGVRLRSIATQACSFIGMRDGNEPPEAGGIFFRNAAARYLPEPSPAARLSILAVRRDDAVPELLEGADVVVARRETFFAISRAS